MQKVQEFVGTVTGGATKLPTAKLGKNGPQVTRMGYGTMGLSAFYGTPKPDEERLKVLSTCYEAGELFWDTADMYMDSEDLLGNWFKANPGKREHIFLATKFANKVLEDGSRAVDSSPEYCREACERSLKRLGVSHIDLYYAHRLDGKTPIEKTAEALKQLKHEGKIKYTGLSECSSESLRRACKVVHIDAVQIEYSPFSLDIETEQIGLMKTCRELGCAIVAYSPLGRGMLSGQIRSPDDFEEADFRRFAPRFSGENFPKNLKLVDQISEISKKKGCTPSQLTLAWLLAQGDDVFPIPGTTNLKRVDENLGALDIKLSKEEEQEVRKACEAAEMHGGRYPEAFASLCFSDTPPLDAASGSIADSPALSSPYTVLTGLIDRPLPGQDENWMLDLELMNHYSNHTKEILTEHQDNEDIHRIWREEIPKVAFGSDYCMHALLGFSALHKAYIEPYHAPMLRTCAVNHLDRALVFYREHGHPTTAENADAKFAFTWLVALFAYAVPPSVPAIDAIGELLLLVNGIDTVLAETWFWVSQGPFALILTAGPYGPITLPREGHTLVEGMDFGIGHLDYMLGLDAMLPDDRRTCALVLGELKQVYNNVLRQQGQSSIASIICFPKKDAAAFSALIKQRVPQALVIVAYYCVLLDVLDRGSRFRWWIHGWARRVIQEISSTLDQQWQRWIEWPVQSVMVKEGVTLAPLDLLM
ncbi:hypothetical protein LTR08_003440 [Meristemomyces frigidus]|nr:hypothetical protein LTR08_003440 [Meristemomyces frigidus]